ncbi:hypothetical protein DdX_09718 [Ditylenchus destructor]|uniref:Uncharacterized protein n=1 Tax=Ditylenchus destructor TaxID=166010 RepID=A0AAD4N5L9_9BILA|nr:hypothetical protein DdX_09718 [Ditylenchus destructor]
MASGNPENPGFGQVTDPPSGLRSGRVIRQSLRLGETRRLVPVSAWTNHFAGRCGFRKSGKSWTGAPPCGEAAGWSERISLCRLRQFADRQFADSGSLQTQKKALCRLRQFADPKSLLANQAVSF